MKQIIEYNYLTRQQFLNATENPLDPANVQNAALIAHETPHFIDHISTLSGQKLLLDIFNAYSAVDNRDKKQYWRVIKLQQVLKNTKYEEHYKEYGQNYSITSKGHDGWTFRSSFGARLDVEGKEDLNFPIIFNNYKYRGQFVGKIPLSLESLWETNAVASEIDLHVASIILMEDKDQAAISTQLIQNHYKDWLYDPKMLTYSIAAQLVSSLLGYGDIHTAFMISKSLSSIALNLPKTCYKNIKIPKDSGVPEDRIENLTNSDDPSCMFYLMVLNVKEAKEDILASNGYVDVEKVLRINGFPEKEILEREIKKEMEFQKSEALDGPNKEVYLYFYNLGVKLFEKIGIDSAPYTLAYAKFAKSTLNICCEECLDDSNEIVIRDSAFDFLLAEINNVIENYGN
ncbi:hypothetical protein [Paenibacillus amylolyticus]|uniref:hypothetical protein n=2 Tax=Paenibacillus TaxID=44249 RepID=UPI000FDA771E|nr:hypothetical protein [Paenibacillus amylolyticus]